MPPLEDIIDNNGNPDMPSLEEIFDDDMYDNDNILNHESIDFAPNVATTSPKTSIEIHNVKSEKDAENIQKPKSAGSAS